MRRIRVGVVGVGFIGERHIDALRRVDGVDLVAIADQDHDRVVKMAESYGIANWYGSVDDVLENVDAIHNCTPNNFHLEVNERAIRAGVHVFSEKPLALDSGESLRMLDLLRERPEVVHGVNFNYRMNPMVQEVRQKIKSGAIGTVRLVHGAYLQDWLLYETDYNWRIEPSVGGRSRAIADIGSHWMDTVQAATGGRITAVCADLSTVIPVRKAPLHSGKTFGDSRSEEYEEKPVSNEDYGAVLFSMDNGARGVFYVSQVSAGRKNYLHFEVNGSEASFHWNQERPEEIWVGYRNRANCQMLRSPDQMSGEALPYTTLPAGHPEGWNDALKNNIGRFYRFIADGGRIGSQPCGFATFADGHYVMKLTEAILKSSRTRRWIALESESAETAVETESADEALIDEWSRQLWEKETAYRHSEVDVIHPIG